MTERSYRLTEAGRAAWESQDAAVPADYRRLLWLMDFHGYAGLMQQMVPNHPKHVLEEWLEELNQLGLVEELPAGAAAQHDFSLPDHHPPAEDYTSVKPGAQPQPASAPLARTGAFIAIDRNRMRQIEPKPPKETEILIVEDDPDQATLADLRMTIAGYQVRLAHSAKQLLESMFDEGAPDLLLLDVELPDGNGFDILQRLRRHKTLSDLPIVLLSSMNDAESIGKGLALGADGYVTKPYTKNILAEVVRKILNQPAE